MRVENARMWLVGMDSEGDVCGLLNVWLHRD